MPAGHVDCIRTGIGDPTGNIHRLGGSQATIEEIIAIHAKDHGEARNGSPDRRGNLERETRPVGQFAAITVLPRVLQRRHQLRQKIAMRAVQFHRIEAGPFSPRCGGGKGRDRLGNAGRAHLGGDDGFGVAFLHMMGDCRGRDGGLPAYVGARVPAPVTKLDRCLCASALDAGHNPRKARQEPVVRYGQFEMPVLARRFRRGHLDGHEPGPALRARPVVCLGLPGGVPFGIRQARCHWRHHDPVCKFHRADPARAEQRTLNSLIRHGGGVHSFRTRSASRPRR